VRSGIRTSKPPRDGGRQRFERPVKASSADGRRRSAADVDAHEVIDVLRRDATGRSYHG